ncbi:uncharacterized protein T551_01028 [Pneumocystis jirovecii RU7]|uniref:ribonuclease Z n=1 Tax=Pneumocystis jirovecii (strain RU7) TaxID=1408657 RepID=A0A0W4ZTQ4_PNEJ7|nr:uncharacterized protein T551_01028 [Pneumocystis jirovecii RU7]KTW31767.1 hypothetical protein T551_01028 [Pneumocystis jirovecii RU7]
MKSYVQIVQVPSADTNLQPSILLHYDKKRYLFGAGEAIQRTCVGRKIKIRKIREVFLTFGSRGIWEGFGGFPGAVHDIRELMLNQFEGDVTIHGPQNTFYLMLTLRHFIYRPNIKIKINEFRSETHKFVDENITITPVISSPYNHKFNNETHKIEGFYDKKRPFGEFLKDIDDNEELMQKMFLCSSSNEVKITCSENNHEENLLFNSNNISFENMQNKFKITPFSLSVTYICEGHSQPGKFDPDAAKALGITPGPQFGKLSKGENIVLDDGRVIFPHQVIGEPRPGSIFIIVDCPDKNYIDSLIQRDIWSTYYKTGEKKVQLIVHMVNEDVLNDSRYINWMYQFSEKVQHIISCPSLCPDLITHRKVALQQLKLNRLSRDHFPLPQCMTFQSKKDQLNLENLLVTGIKPLQKFILEPTPLFLEDEVPLPIDLESPENFEGLDIYLSLAKEANDNILRDREKNNAKSNASGSNVRVITLGTGSAFPSHYRNVSSTLLRIPGYGSVMLDAGEGTLGQLSRQFGLGLNAFLEDLKWIYISHLHADHHLGTVRVLKEWNRVNHGNDRVIYISAPWKYFYFLQEFSNIEDFGWKRIKVILNEDVCEDANLKKGILGLHTCSTNINDLLKDLSLLSFSTVSAIHCPWSFSMQITHKDGWKVAYSGDTRPNENFIKLGMNSTLLIHEATLDDDKLQEAIKKKHSTTSEAIDIGKKMNAGFTLLTHFSQRYPKIPNFIMNDNCNKNKLGIAFDGMEVKFSDFWKLPYYSNALKVLYADEFNEKEDFLLE